MHLKCVLYLNQVWPGVRATAWRQRSYCVRNPPIMRDNGDSLAIITDV